MLRTVQDLQRCSIVDREGEVGSLYDVFFDNKRWVVRWFVLERQVAGCYVLLSPAVVNNIDWGALSIELDLNEITSTILSALKPGTHLLGTSATSE